jgi:hypothetical protein
MPKLTGKSAIMLNARSISGYQGNLNIGSRSIAGAGSVDWADVGVTSIVGGSGGATGGAGMMFIVIPSPVSLERFAKSPNASPSMYLIACIAGMLFAASRISRAR